jgi:3-hydroxyisobutyrate dehydrogenase-like beta-hydroxyacid dehydrogenase
MSGERTAIGFVGLGNLGMGMASRLLEAGFAVVGSDRDESRLRTQEAAGGRRGDLDSVFTCEIVCVVTPDEAPVAEYFEGRTASPGVRTVLLHSTVLPAHAHELARTLAAVGATLVEAPVSGGPDAARRGQLTVLLGGSAEAVAAVDDVLTALASRSFALGEVGAASATKLANQLLMLAAVQAAHEALELTDAFRVDRSAALEAISAATGDTWVGRNWGFFDAIVADYDRAGTPSDQRPWRKDLREFVEAAEAARIDAPLAERLLDTVGDRIEHAARTHQQGGTS